MSLLTHRRIEERAEGLARTWLEEHPSETEGLGWLDQRELQRTKYDELLPQAAAEIRAEEEAERQRLIDSVWESGLAPSVVTYFELLAERERLTTERDARIAAITAEYQLPEPWKQIEIYNQARAQLLLDRVAAAGLELCYTCGTAKNDVVLVMLVGQGQNSITDCMSRKTWTETYRRLARQCSDCRAKAHQPITAEHLAQYPEASYCLVQNAVVENDTVIAEYDDGWRAVTEPIERLERDYFGRDSIGDRLATAWKLPPELKGGSRGIWIRRMMDDDVTVPERELASS